MQSGQSRGNSRDMRKALRALKLAVLWGKTSGQNLGAAVIELDNVGYNYGGGELLSPSFSSHGTRVGRRSSVAPPAHYSASGRSGGWGAATPTDCRIFLPRC